MRNKFIKIFSIFAIFVFLYGGGLKQANQLASENVGGGTGTIDRLPIRPTIGGTVVGGTAGSVLFINPTNTLAQDNPNFTYTTAGGLRIGPTSAAISSENKLSVIGDANDYHGIFVQNKCSGSKTLGSTDIVVGNDLTTADPTTFADFGVNCSGNTNPAYTLFGASDAYLFTSGSVNDLNIGTGNAKDIKFFTGGTLTANEKMRVTSGGVVKIVTNGEKLVIGDGTNSFTDISFSGSRGFVGYDGVSQVLQSGVAKNIKLLVNNASFGSGTLALFIDGVTNPGFVGIGTTSPATLLTVSPASGNSLVTVNAVSGSQAGVVFGSGGASSWQLYRPASSTDLRLYDFGGTPGDRVTFQTSTGNVGIGTSSPGAKLDTVETATGVTAIWYGNRVTNAGTTFNTTGGVLTGYTGFFNNTSTRASGANNLGNVGIYASASGAQANYAAIFDQGFVGIGTTSPARSLDVYGATTNDTSINVSSVTAGPNDGTLGYLAMLFGVHSSATAGSRYVYIYGGDNSAIRPLILNVSNTGSFGNVGIGVTAPSFKLDVRGGGNDVTSASIQIRNFAALGNTSAAGFLNIAASDASGFIAAFPSDYGTSISQDRIVLGANSDATGVNINAVLSGQDIRFFAGSSTESARFDSSGKLGIGTTSPQSTLQVNGSFSLPYVAKTTTYTATVSDYEIDCTSGTFTVSLPNSASTNVGRIYVVTNSGAGTITVTTVGGVQIVGNDAVTTSQSLAAGASKSFHSTATGWRLN